MTPEVIETMRKVIGQELEYAAVTDKPHLRIPRLEEVLVTMGQFAMMLLDVVDAQTREMASLTQTVERQRMLMAMHDVVQEPTNLTVQ